MRIVIGGTIGLALVVAAILLWPVDHAPTLPDTGPGVPRVSGSAAIPSPSDAGGEGPAHR